MLTGIGNEISKCVFRGKLRVLFYHRVNPSGDIFSVHPSEFEQQIRYLRRNYSVLNLKDYLALLRGDRSISNGVLVTFDDGYKDNYTYAYPVLKKYSVPAAIFLTTDFIDGKMWLWFDMARHIFEMTSRTSIELKVNGVDTRFDLKRRSHKYKARRHFFTSVKNLTMKEKVLEIRKLAELLNAQVPDLPTNDYAPLSWKDIREMTDHKIDFGAHTCSHDFLSCLGKDEAYYQIFHSKQVIEEQLQLPVDAFAYPNGQHTDFTDETKSLVRKAGFQCAFTTVPQMSDCDDRFALGRFFPGNNFNAYFMSQVAGFNLLKEKIRKFAGRENTIIKAIQAKLQRSCVPGLS